MALARMRLLRSCAPIASSAVSKMMPSIALELQPLLAVATATVDESGTLIDANAGFLRLIDLKGLPPRGARVGRFFLQPDFTTLIRLQPAIDGEIYHGLLTLGDYMGRPRTLCARVWRVEERRLRMVAEFDIADLERLNDTVLRLNRDYADAQIKLAQLNLALQQREAQILALSLTDSLTGVGNRRRMEEALVIEIERAQRTGEKLCAFIADIDHFKRVNDSFGHEAGDKVLAAVGDLLRRQTRATDVVTRFGGEEFVVLLPHTNLEQAVANAERSRKLLEANRIDPLPEPITASFGVAELASGESRDALLQRLDKALYKAKDQGRNRVIAAEGKIQDPSPMGVARRRI